MGFNRIDEAATSERPSRLARRLRLALIALVVVIVLWGVGGQFLWFYLNTIEFGELFILPIYFELLGGSFLAAIALFRVDVKNRRSLAWWGLRLLLRLLREKMILEYVPPEYLNFKAFKLTPSKFLMWQLTKVVLGTAFFSNLFFGLSLYSMSRGWDPGLNALLGIFSLPFVTPPFDVVYAQAYVVPLLPSLTLLVSPILGAFTFRYVALVLITQLVRVLTPSLIRQSTERLTTRVAAIEGVLAVGLFWIMLSLFFPSFIDYNTKYYVAGFGIAALVFAVFAYLDQTSSRGLSILARRPAYMRAGALLIIILLISSIVAVNNSIADARKVEWRGPYTVQQIGVNRHLAQLDEVQEIPYAFVTPAILADQIDPYVAAQRDLLSKIRLWDWEATFDKLKPEIGLIPYLGFEDSDILRFNDTLYWSASLRPVLPATVSPADRWYADHLVYSHVPIGFLLLDGNQGAIQNTTQFFQQRKIYYGEGGLLQETWAAYPKDRVISDELGGYFYEGTGGLDLPPPLSWLFEFNFFLAFRDQTIRLLRYRDIFDRTQILLPYFQHAFNGEPVDMFPVTDGRNTYWLMPLILSLDTSNVPWSGGNPFRRLVGYAIIDIYNGSYQILVIGTDYFSELFKRAYSEFITTEVPEWLKTQIRYPAELFDWRVEMYNFYHVTDASTFIVAKEFFETPPGLASYFLIAKPPAFQSPEFLGLLSLELRGAREGGGRNLAGYMIVRNNYENLGEMMFYQVPLESTTKLLGPTAVKEALEKDPEFATLRTLLSSGGRTPRIGEIILYRIGDLDVYFIPVYTAQPGGVVTEMGAVAAVGATFTGNYYVGLGTAGTAESAFRSLLGELAGVQVPPGVQLGAEERKANLVSLLESLGLTIARPSTVNPDVTFVEGVSKYVTEVEFNATRILLTKFALDWGSRADKVLFWTDPVKSSLVNFGVLINVNGVVELHFVTVQIE